VFGIPPKNIEVGATIWQKTVKAPFPVDLKPRDLGLIIHFELDKSAPGIGVWQIVDLICLAFIPAWREEDLSAGHRLERLEPSQEVNEMLRLDEAETPWSTDIDVIESDTQRPIGA
jgi:hypothetical protein